VFLWGSKEEEGEHSVVEYGAADRTRTHDEPRQNGFLWRAFFYQVNCSCRLGRKRPYGRQEKRWSWKSRGDEQITSVFAFRTMSKEGIRSEMGSVCGSRAPSNRFSGATFRASGGGCVRVHPKCGGNLFSRLTGPFRGDSVVRFSFGVG